MASVTFLEPSGSNLLSTQISRTGLTNLNVTRNSAPWINSNYDPRLWGWMAEIWHLLTTVIYQSGRR